MDGLSGNEPHIWTSPLLAAIEAAAKGADAPARRGQNKGQWDISTGMVIWRRMWRVLLPRLNRGKAPAL